MPGDYPALHRMENALQPLTGNLSGPFYMTVIGTVNTVGGGTGGTSSIDNSTFTAGGTSITPVGGYQGGRTVASGRTAAFAIDGSGNMQVNVVAGGAGGGVANITVRGTANTDLKVGFASGANPAWPNQDGAAWLPVMFPSGFYPTVNTAGGGAGFATVGVYGSVGVVGSVNITGSLNPVGVFGSMSVVGSVNITGSLNPVGVFGSLNANQMVAGTGNTAYRVGYASQNLGAWPNYDGAAWMPVFFPSGFYPTVNAAIGAAGVFGSVQVVGSVNITGSLNPVGVFGSMSVVGSVNVTQGTLPLPMVGSVNVTQGTLPMPVLGSVNMGGVGVVDTRGSLAPTQWIISTPASGQYQVAGSAPAAMRDYFTSFHLIANGTVDFQWMSPSGVAISGSMRLLPGAGFALPGALGAGPNLIGAVQGGVYLQSAGTQNIGGMAVGWVGA